MGTDWKIVSLIVGLCLSVAVIIFQAGGFVIVMKNHLSHVNSTMKGFEVRLRALELLVQEIKTKCDLLLGQKGNPNAKTVNPKNG